MLQEVRVKLDVSFSMGAEIDTDVLQALVSQQVNAWIAGLENPVIHTAKFAEEHDIYSRRKDKRIAWKNF